MNPMSAERRLPVAWLIAGLVLLSPAAHGTGEAQAWLQRMAAATRDLNYDGTFVYHNGNWMQSMRVIHRAASEGSRERLVALTGDGREVLRDNTRVICILPADRTVVVGKSRPSKLTGAPAFEPSAGFTASYSLATLPGRRVAGRHTQLVTVSPTDNYRYGYHLSIDRDTALLLKSELLGPDGSVVEQVEYTSISTPQHIPDELLEPSISSAGFTWLTAPEQPLSDAESTTSESWSVDWLPAGFVMTERENELLPTSRNPVEHMVYTDGLASVSIYIERLEVAAEQLDGLSQMGAVNAFGRMIDQYQVTVVGEIPAVTVTMIGESIQRR